jgi:hypothetical protein
MEELVNLKKLYISLKQSIQKALLEPNSRYEPASANEICERIQKLKAEAQSSLEIQKVFINKIILLVIPM